jgi:DNA-binding MarR family transcriptional regulator
LSRKDTSRAGADGIDYGPLQNWVGFHLRMAQSASFHAFARLTHEEDIQPGRFATLLLIGRNPGISQTSLSLANGRDKSTLTPVLNDLVRRGLVRRERTPADRRAYRLALTGAGARKLARLTECATRHDRNLDRIIGAAERARFLATLRRIEAALIPHWGENAEPAAAVPAARAKRAAARARTSGVRTGSPAP